MMIFALRVPPIPSTARSRADASALLHLVGELQPRVVVALRSSGAADAATTSMVAELGKLASRVRMSRARQPHMRSLPRPPLVQQVVSPAIGERVDISSHTRQFRARLRDALFASAVFQRVGEGYDVAHIDAEVAAGASYCLPRPVIYAVLVIRCR